MYKYDEHGETNHRAQQRPGELVQQLQGHKWDEARRNYCEEQQSHHSIKDVHGIGAEGNQDSQQLLCQSFCIAQEKGQGTEDYDKRSKDERSHKHHQCKHSYVQQVWMEKKQEGAYWEEHIAPGGRIGCRHADMQQDIARHAQIGIQAAIHDQCG